MDLIIFLKEINNNFEECFVVGGAVRDVILKKDVFDIDIIIKNLSKNKLRKLTKSNNLPFVILDDTFNIYRIIVDSKNIDISNYKDLNFDLKRRDFTINALCIKLIDFISYLENLNKSEFLKKIIDNFNGLKDIKRKVLRLVDKSAVEEDPLRILRAARFMCQGFKIEKKDEKIIRRSRSLLKKVASERISEELKKIFNYNCFGVLEWLDKNKILEQIIPELKIMKVDGRNTKFRNFYFHKEGLWQHAKLTFKKVEYILKNIKKIFKKDHLLVQKEIRDKIYLIKYASLLHDIAKPLVVSKQKGKVRFFYHEKRSEEIVRKILTKLKLSNYEVNFICLLVGQHMRIGNLCHSKDATERAFIRLFNETKETLVPLMIISLADRYSYDSIPQRAKILKLKELPVFRSFLRKLLQKHVEFKNKCLQPKIIDGHQVMKLLSIKEGPLVGKILKLVREEQLLGRIKTNKEAVQFIKKIKIKENSDKIQANSQIVNSLF